MAFTSGSICSKLTMSLVSLKFWSLDMAYTLIFLLKNASTFCICSHFFNKKYLWIRYLLTRTVNILTTNELVKLTMLWTTGPRLLLLLTVLRQFSLCWLLVVWPCGCLLLCYFRFCSVRCLMLIVSYWGRSLSISVDRRAVSTICFKWHLIHFWSNWLVTWKEVSGRTVEQK